MNYKGIVLLICTVLAFSLCPKTVIADVPTSNSSALSTFTADEKNYLVNAYRYMAMEQKEGLLVAGMISNLSSETATVGNLGDTIRSALSETNDAYNVYRGVNVPLKYSQLNLNIINTYTLFNSAYTEFLQFWTDGNDVHIVNGGPVLEKAAMQQHDILIFLNNTILPKR